MPEPCGCGDRCCARCYPWSYRQARAWERDQAAMDRMTAAELEAEDVEEEAVARLEERATEKGVRDEQVR